MKTTEGTAAKSQLYGRRIGRVFGFFAAYKALKIGITVVGCTATVTASIPLAYAIPVLLVAAATGAALGALIGHGVGRALEAGELKKAADFDAIFCGQPA